MVAFMRILTFCIGLVLLSACSDDQADPATASEAKAQSALQVSAAGGAELPAALQILDVSEREHDGRNVIAVLFNHPVDPDQRFSKYVTVTPALQTPVLDPKGRSLLLSGVQPETNYKIEVQAGLEAADSQKLVANHDFKLKSRALPEVVAFEVDGAVMVPGQVDSLPILAVNIPEAEVSIYRVKPNERIEFFEQYNALKSGESWMFEEKQFEQTLQHIYASRIKISTEENRRNRIAFPLSNIPEVTKEGGLYLATVRKPGGFHYEATWFTVSSIGLHARHYDDHIRYIAQDLRTGELMPGVELHLLDQKNRTITEGITDAEGSWEISNRHPRRSPRMILAHKDSFVTVLNYHAPTFDLSEYSVAQRPMQSVEHFLYSPRDIYRPGEEMVLSILRRDHDGQLMDEGPVQLELFKPDGERYGSWNLESESHGYYEFRQHLGVRQPVGQWRAKVYSPGRKSEASYFDFKLEAFLPERMRLVFAEPKDSLISFTQGEEVAVKLRGEYLYGAPANGNRLDTALNINPWQQPFSQHKGFVFGQPDKVARDQFSLASMTLGESGETRTAVTSKQYDWRDLETPARLRFTYSLFESGGRAINRTRSVLLWPKPSFVGVKPHFQNDRADADSQANFELIRTDKAGTLLGEGSAKATLYRIEEKYFWTHTPDRGWHYQIDKNEYVVDNRTLTLSADSPTPVDFAVESGKYRLELEDLSAKSKTVYAFQAGDDWYYRWHSGSDRIRPDQISIALDKAAYRAGEEVTVKLHSPTPGNLILLLETDRVLHSQQVKLDTLEGEATFTLPDDIDRHDLYVSAFLVPGTDQLDKVSKRSFGVVHLPLERADKQLQVTIEAAEQLLPENPAEVVVQVRDQAGEVVDGDYVVTLSAVDSGVLSITGYKPGNPFEYFYQPRSYNPQLSDMYEHLVDQHNLSAAEVRWGGDGELSRGGKKAPTEVRILSLFSSLVSVENGQAVITLDLPDFDGELTLNALAVGEDQFGAERKIVKVAAPVVAQFSVPRFLALGDQAELALDLANSTDAPQTLSLQLRTLGALKSSEKTLTLQLAVGEKRVLNLTAEATALGRGEISAEIVLKGDAGSGEQAADQTFLRDAIINVRGAAPAVFAKQTKVLTPGEQFAFPAAQLDKLIPSSLEARIGIASTPDLDAASHFKQLMRYPYACLEQTTSKAQPLALLLSDQPPSFATPVSDTKLQRELQSALDRYAELQRADGSFGLWGKQSPEEHWLTVYATEFMLKLKAAGQPVPEEMLESALYRIQRYVTQPASVTVQRRGNASHYYELAYRAYAAYLLAKEGRITLGPVRDLAETRMRYSQSKLPGVYLGLAMYELGSISEAEALVAEALHQPRSEGYLGDYGSDIRDSALAMSLVMPYKKLSKHVHAQVLSMLPVLMVQSEQRRWLSTQEQAALMRLADQLERLGGHQPWQVQYNQADELRKRAGQGGEHHRIEPEHLAAIKAENTGDNPVLVTFSWSGQPRDLESAVDEGVTLSTEYFRVKGGKAVAMAKNPQLKTGELLLSKTVIYSETEIPDALLVALLPAGLELENQNLKHSLKLADIEIDGQKLESDAWFAYQGYLDDRYVAAIELPNEREQVVYTLSRAVTPGEFAMPQTLVESMYTPETRGLSQGYGRLTVTK